MTRDAGMTTVTSRSTFVLDQRIRYDYSAPVHDLRQRLIVVPPRTHSNQRRHRWSMQVAGVDEARTQTRRDTFSNLVIDVRVPSIASWIEFAVEADISLEADRPAVMVAADRRYLEFTPLTAPDPTLVALAAGVGDEPDPAVVCRAVHESLTYEWGITGIRTTAAEALAGGRGVCQDYAHIMLSVCRQVGIPARYVSGHLIGEGGSHAWVEVLRPISARRWMVEAWDPTHDALVGDRHITIAVGRDYADVPMMSGSFDGSGTGTLTAHKRVLAA
ncbi:MAG TPA: transglutaminase family protein [Acidimicrobiales bacterium]|nr:transglutaminase family protein [Acidimicrobiales bacterium]